MVTTGNEFSVMLHFPKSWEDFSGQKQYEFKGNYHTSGHQNHSQISEKFIIPFKEGYSLEEVQDKSWFTDTFKYELRSKDQVVTIIAHGA